jgi:3-hydroxyisobutyrate dehydrogenase-like beta-hydroxyacid dehydrogenase
MSNQNQSVSERARTVSVIGLGAMGSALARAFLTAGHSVTVWNRTAEKGAPLVQAGARQANSVAEAAQASGVIVVCVLDYSVSDGVLNTAEVVEKLRGKTVVQLTTGTPRLARESEAWAGQCGISYLDGAIMSYPSGIGTPDCTILYAGAQNVFETHKGLLASLGGNGMFVGERIGNASTLDSSLLSFVFTAETGFLHGAALCEAEGFPIETYHETAAALMPILVADMAKATGMISQRNYVGLEASMAICRAAFGNILRSSDEAGVDRACSEALVSLTKRAIAAGFGGDEFPSLFEVLRKRNTHGPA